MAMRSIDYSLNRLIPLVDENENVTTHRTVLDAVQACSPGDILFMESPTLRSFGIDREALRAAATDLGVRIAVVSSRQNTKRRQRYGFVVPKPQNGNSDVEDAVGILRSVREGKSSWTFVNDVDLDWIRRAQAAATDHMNLRRSRRFATGARGGLKVITAKEDLAARLIPHLPILPAEFTAELGDGKGSYNANLVATMHSVCRAVTSRKEMERLAGLWDNGYPTIFRSEFYHWGYAKRGLSDLTKYRRALRWLYHQMKSIN